MRIAPESDQDNEHPVTPSPIKRLYVCPLFIFVDHFIIAQSRISSKIPDVTDDEDLEDELPLTLSPTKRL